MPAGSNRATTRTMNPKRSRRDGNSDVSNGTLEEDDDDNDGEENNGESVDSGTDDARDNEHGGTTAGSQKKKRKAREGNGNDGGGFTTDPSKLAMMSRSERKRHREKKRRSDVNKGFEDLISLLVEVDSGVRLEVEEERARRLQVRAGAGAGAGSSSGDAPTANIHNSKVQFRRAETSSSAASASTGDDNILSRVDMIDRATTVLRRLHGENEQRKVLIEHLMAQQGRLNVDPSTAARSSAPLFLFDQPSWVRPTRSLNGQTMLLSFTCVDVCTLGGLTLAIAGSEKRAHLQRVRARGIVPGVHLELDARHGEPCNAPRRRLATRRDDASAHGATAETAGRSMAGRRIGRMEPPTSPVSNSARATIPVAIGGSPVHPTRPFLVTGTGRTGRPRLKRVRSVGAVKHPVIAAVASSANPAPSAAAAAAARAGRRRWGSPVM
jgi:hypothetical protein